MPKAELHKEPVPKQDPIPGVPLVSVKAWCMLSKFEKWKRGFLKPDLELQSLEEPVPKGEPLQKQEPVLKQEPVKEVALVRDITRCMP